MLMKMEGGGGDGDQAAAKPGFSSEGYPYQKPKTQRIWPTIFLKMGDYPPHSQKWRDASPRPPSHPPVAEPLFSTVGVLDYPIDSVNPTKVSLRFQQVVPVGTQRSCQPKLGSEARGPGQSSLLVHRPDVRRAVSEER